MSVYSAKIDKWLNPPRFLGGIRGPTSDRLFIRGISGFNNVAIESFLKCSDVNHVTLRDNVGPRGCQTVFYVVEMSRGS